MNWKRILLAAVVTYLLAWPLPSLVVSIDSPLGLSTEVVRGWQATRWALSPLWPGGERIEAGFPLTLLILASGLSNLLFVAAAVMAWRSHGVPRALAWAVWGAALVNMQWFVYARADVRELRIGYYLWMCSFVLLAIALGRLRRATPPDPSARPQA
jgi:hypothetical protein